MVMDCLDKPVLYSTLLHKKRLQRVLSPEYVFDQQPDPQTITPDILVEDAGEDKKPADDNAIKVSGSIQLPKAKDSAKPATK